MAGALREDRAGPGRGSDGGGGSGWGGSGGGILNISLFGGIRPAMRPNGVFFGLFLPIFGVFGQTRVFGILPICRIRGPTFSICRIEFLICRIKK